MSNHALKEIDKQLGRIPDLELSVPPSSDVNEALRVVDYFESKGFSFRLKDMVPKSLSESRWRATFTHAETEFVAEDSQPAVAICIAAAAVLTGSQ